MNAGKKHNALEGIKKAQLKRRVFTLEFKAEVVLSISGIKAPPCFRRNGATGVAVV